MEGELWVPSTPVALAEEDDGPMDAELWVPSTPVMLAEDGDGPMDGSRRR